MRPLQKGLCKATLIGVIVFLSLSQPRFAQEQDRWYRGASLSLAQPSSVPGEERWYGGASTDAHWGDAGDIYTINPSIPFWTGDHLFEYVSVIVSIQPLYWIQLGYHAWRGFWQELYRRYYREKWDAIDGWVQDNFPDGPDEDSWHRYAILNAYPYFGPEDRYDFFIDYGSRGSYTVYPYTPQERMDATAETTNPDIDITGTHFRQLMYYDREYEPDVGLKEYYWSHTWQLQRIPYHSSLITQYEFIAWRE